MVKKMEENEDKIRILLVYGKVLLECNFDLAEIRSDMYHLMNQMGLHHLSIFMTQTSLMLIDNTTDNVKMIKIDSYAYNFEKISHIHELVLQLSLKKISLQEFYTALVAIDKKSYAFSTPTQVVHAGIICGAMYSLINGWSNLVFVSFILGSFGYFCFLTCQKYLKIKLFTIFLYSIFITICSMILYKVLHLHNDFALILSCMMPLFPGATLVNAIRAGINGDYIVSLSQGVEAINTALMLGLPVAFLLTIAV